MMDTALVVGDVQVGILEQFEWSRVVLDPLATAIAAARAHDVPVVFIRTELRAAPGDIPARNPVATWMQGTGELFGEGSPQTALHPDLARRTDEPVVVKRRVSGFTGTDLDALLRARGITSLVLSGVATSGVVLATLLAGAELDYAVTVLADGCADQDDAVHDLLLGSVFPGRGARVATCAEWATALQHQTADGTR